MKYQRLIDRRDELLTKGKKLYLEGKDTIEYDMEIDCIDHFFEAGGLKNYETIASFCKENNIDKVIDIGCAYAHQSECFLNSDIEYMGVNNHSHKYWNSGQFQYITGNYPCELPVKSKDLAVSVLCLTWNCYLYEGEKTLIEQCKALKRDFDHCLLYVTNNGKEMMSRYFPTVKEVRGGFYYFSK